MLAITVTKLIAFIHGCDETIKLWYADTRTFRSKIVDLDDPDFCDQIESREHTYHVSREGKNDYTEDFTAKFYCFATAYETFKAIIQHKGYHEVVVCDDFESYNPYKDFDEEPMSREEEYQDACMAEAYGNPTLMQRYNRKYQIEDDYGPSNPWDAPGMKVSDFI